MTAHHFLTQPLATPPIMPSERWISAYPSGHANPWDALHSQAKAGDVVWVAVAHANWQERVAALVRPELRRRVVVLSPTPYEAEGLRAIHAGAHGYCHLHALPELLREVGSAVQAGALWVGPELVDRIVGATRTLLSQSGHAAAGVPPVDFSLLSARELQVARAVADGKSNKEVASQLYISERTVKAHLGSVFEKLGVRDRVQLVLHMSSVSEPEVQAYLSGLPDELNDLSHSDAGLARVTEDLIDVLINRGVIQFTDLPDAAQRKLMERRQYRARLSDRLKLIPDENDRSLI